MNKYHLVGLVACVLVIVTIVPYGRVSNDQPVFPGEYSYFHLKQAEKWDVNILENKDLTLFHKFVGFVKQNFGENSVILVPPILSFLILILFFLILNYFSFNSIISWAGTILFALSPGFIFLSSHLTPKSLSLLFLLLGILMLIRNLNYIAIVAFILLSLLGFYETMIGVLGLLCMSLFDRKYMKISAIIFLCMAVSTVLLPNSFISIFSNPSLLQEFISELGGKLGFGIFYLIPFS